MQWVLKDPTFTVRYWDWTVESNRNSLFTDDKLGGNDNGDVTGEYYGSQNWKTICWKIKKKGITCDPSDESARYTLRRCPSEMDCNNTMNWPTKESVKKALSYDTFAEDPYNKYSTETFSNALEGFEPEKKCSISDSLGAYTTCDCNTRVTRELHNLV